MRAMLGLLLAALILPASASAAVTPGPAEAITSWTQAVPLNGGTAPKVTRATRKIRISVGFGVCDVDQDHPISRIVTERRKHTIIITVLLRSVKTPPYTVCPDLARIVKRKVSLQGRLGARSIRDGSSGAVQIKKPKA